MARSEQVSWHKIEPGDLEVDRVTTMVVAGRALCVTRTETGYGVLDNRCPHQGGPARGQAGHRWRQRLGISRDL